MSSGAIVNTTSSLASSAESPPATPTVSASIMVGVSAFCMIQSAASSKNPAETNCAEMIISAKSSTKVETSILVPSSSSVTVALASRTITPSSAMPVRSICRCGSRPAAMPT